MPTDRLNALEPTARPVPKVGVVGTLRWLWRQLTSMRTALALLMLLALAALPGSVLPQRPQQPAAVRDFLAANPTWGPWLDRLGFFDVFAAPWFAAVYLLLFISLIGCIVPRIRTHVAALRSSPPRPPARFDRFAAHQTGTTDLTPDEAMAAAVRYLRGRRYRVRTTTGERPAISAETGYARESGNLVFHVALLGLLIAVAAGQLLSYRGQAVIVQGQTAVNSAVSFDTMETGRWFDQAGLEPFTVRLDDFESEFTLDGAASPRDFTAAVTVTEPGQSPYPATIKVNRPLSVAGTKIYLQGNGFAPNVEVRDATGTVVFAGPVPFLPQDGMYTSRGVIKVPDVSTGPQLGFVGWLFPTADIDEAGIRSVYPQPISPMLVLTVYTGDLGLDSGIPQNVRVLDETNLTLLQADGVPVALTLAPGETEPLPDGLGSVTFVDLPRFVALDLRHDPALGWILGFALAALTGLTVSLFVPRRRLWLRLDGSDGTTAVAAAGLARGGDPGLNGAVGALFAAVSGVTKPATERTVAQPAGEEG